MVSDGEVTIRRVRLLTGRAKEQAFASGFKDNDIVLIKTTVASLPKFEIVKVDGSPSTFITNYFKA